MRTNFSPCKQVQRKNPLIWKGWMEMIPKQNKNIQQVARSLSMNEGNALIISSLLGILLKKWKD